MKTTTDIVREGVREVLDTYFTGDMTNRITREITEKVRAGLEAHEPDRIAAETGFKDCVNELCLRCGSYKREYDGACNGCRWLKPRRGW